jgi:ubiquinol-cytochrome c reductase cytochrome c subunit
MRRLLRRRLIVLPAIAALALAVVTLAHAQLPAGTVKPEASTSLRQLGAQLYAVNCASCHGIDGRGVTSLSPGRGNGSITGLGPSLRGIRAGTVDFYLRTGYMPLRSPYDQPSRRPSPFNDREIRGLVDYVTSLSPPGPPIPTPHPERGSLSEGLFLFTEHCAGCHQVAAQGGVVTGGKVPQLTPDGPVQIAEAVRAGPYLMPKFSTKQISDAQLNSIIRYVVLSHKPVNRGGWALGNIGPVPEGIVTWLIAIPLLIFACAVIGTRFKRR